MSRGSKKVEDMPISEVMALYPEIDFGDMSTPTLYMVFGLLDKIRALEERLKHIEWVDGHGCVDGDCPHDDSRECVTPLIEELKRVAAVARGLTA